MLRRFGTLLLGLLLILATGFGMGISSGARAAASYTTCPTFTQFQSDVQAVAGSATITFVAANCVLSATSMVTVASGASVTIDGNGLVLSDSTVSGNSGAGMTGSNFTVTNSTVTGITTDGVTSSGQFMLTFSTITDNGGDGAKGNEQSYEATILAGNGRNCSEYDYFETDAGYNISTDDSCGFTATGAQDDIDIGDLHLGTLGSNGGPTQTIPLLQSSSALDAIPTTIVDGQTYCTGADPEPITDPATTQSITSDQRGVARPQRSGCDIGAFEVEATATATSAAAASSEDMSIAFSLKATVTADSGTVNEGTVTFHVVDSGGNPVGDEV